MYFSNQTIRCNNNLQINIPSNIPLTNTMLNSANIHNNHQFKNNNSNLYKTLELKAFAFKFIQQHKCSNPNILFKAINRKFARKAKLNGRENNKEKNEIKRGKKFTPEEDEKLKKLVDEMGSQKWDLIAAEMPGRNGRQCRDRYKNYLIPGYFNGQWSKEEDLILRTKFKELGPQWSKIADFLKNRSSNCVKNRWNYFVSKHLDETNEIIERKIDDNKDDIKEKAIMMDPFGDLFDFQKMDENDFYNEDDYFEFSYINDN